jgi:Mg2+ and Co2+ transporter CorA
MEQHFSKHISMHQKVQKTLFFVTSQELEILIKNILLYRKKTSKIHLNILALVNQNPQ